MMGVTGRTLCDWFSFCREVAFQVCIGENEAIGGPGVIVEIDESLFSKRKYHRGRRLAGESVWVFGGVERGSRRAFLVPVGSRSRESLLQVIQKWILPGTTVISDCWRAYDCLSDEGYSHLKVNHSLHFKDPESGAHTNGIEGTWGAAKRGISRSKVKSQLDLYLGEYVWRRRHNNDFKALTKSFFSNLSRIYPC